MSQAVTAVDILRVEARSEAGTVWVFWLYGRVGVSVTFNARGPLDGGVVEMPFVDMKQVDAEPNGSADGEALARQRAIKQIERRQHLHVDVVVGWLGMLLLVAIRAMSEYHNAGGRSTHAFSQSSGIHDVWNYWIVYR
jgi:hypothetical protein